LHIQTNYGWVDIGPKNENFMHFYTDRGKYYFDKQVHVDGDLVLYNTAIKIGKQS